MVVYALLHDGIDLDGSQTHGGGALYAQEYALGAEAPTIHLLEDSVV